MPVFRPFSAARFFVERWVVMATLFTRPRLWLASALACLAIASQALPARADAPKELRMGFAPFEEPTEVLKKARPIVDLLTRELKIPVKPFVATDYPGVVEAMRAGRLDVAIFSPSAMVMAERIAGAKIILKSLYHGHAVYYSAILTRKDSGVTSLKQLKGKTFAFVDNASTTGGIYPKLMLMNAGLNPERDFKAVVNAGGHDASILAVFNKRVTAGASYAYDTKGVDVPWRDVLGKDADQLRVLQYSKPIPNTAVAVSRTLDPKLAEKIRSTLLGLDKSPTGRQELAKMFLIQGFVPASSADYESVREAFDKVGLKI